MFHVLSCMVSPQDTSQVLVKYSTTLSSKCASPNRALKTNKNIQNQNCAFARLCCPFVFCACTLFKFTPAVRHKQHHQTENVQQTRANQIPYLPGRGWGLRGLSDKLLDLSLFLPVTLHLSFLLLWFCALQHEQGPDRGPDRPKVALQDVISRTERGLIKREVENMTKSKKRTRKRKRNE